MLFGPVLLIVGALTTATDITTKKIYNSHLLLAAILGLIATAYSGILLHENVLDHLTNGSAAFLIGLLLYRCELWRGGDAKLFALYAFLMPPAAPATHLLLPLANVVSLFACSFIAGMLILSPFFIRDFIIHRRAILDNLLAPAKRQAFFRGTVRVICFSWILFPVYYFMRLSGALVMLTFMAFFFSEKLKMVKKQYILTFFKETYPVLIGALLFGLAARLWLSPGSLSLTALTQYLLRVTLSATGSALIYTVFGHFNDYHQRVPFAPLLLLGCVLSYTPFLAWTMHAIRLLR